MVLYAPFPLIWYATGLLSEKKFLPLTPPQGLSVCKDRICACIVLYAPFPSNLICNMTTFRKKIVVTFDPTPGVKGVCKDRICACIVLYAPFRSNLTWNLTTFRKILLWHLTPTLGVEGVCKDRICACIVLYAPFRSNLIWNMTTFRKNLLHLTLPQGSRVCMKDRICASMLLLLRFYLIWYAKWSCSEKVEFWCNPKDRGRQGGGGVCGQNICHHVAAFVNPFNLICNMTMFWKSWDFWPHPRVGERGLRAKYFLPSYYVAACVIPLNLISNMTIFWKNWILVSAAPP